MPIRILDEALANKIAAGEVIDRPASVVKELVENALDAGATEVEVVIEEAGRKLIRVTDNGCGMAREEAVLSLQRHATSKIATTEDLFAIRTLGFRGEALPSIASVSHLRMVTRPHDADAGVELLVRGGTITDLNDIGCPPGTLFEIRQLFFNTPARLKFLKSDQTEFGQITELISALSLCHHTVNFRLQHNGREVLSRPATANRLSPIGAWLGREVAERMRPVELQTPSIRVEGYVGAPADARANRGGQLCCINGRRIANRTLTHALEYAYEGLLEAKRYPVAVLAITMDPEMVDVNVHPAKAEVRFHRDGEMHAVVYRAVREALAGIRMTQELAVWQPGANRVSSPPAAPVATGSLALPSLAPATAPTSLAAFTPPTAGAPAPATGLRAIGQLHGTFMLAEGRDGLLVINQHRAHERVIFQQLWSRAGQVEAQRLVLPATLHLGHREATLLEEYREALAGYGFDLGPLSGQSYLVRAVPAALAAQNPEMLLREILTDLETGISIAPFTCDDPAQRAVQESRRRLLAAIACKGALKAGKLLTPREQDHLLDQLQATDSPTICPHGDPIIMTITRYELDRKFQR